jgi:hypothetical protein
LPSILALTGIWIGMNVLFVHIRYLEINKMVYNNNKAWIVECDCCKRGSLVDPGMDEDSVYEMLKECGYQIKSFFGKKTLKCPRCQQ